MPLWLVYALLSAVTAALVAIFGKIGLQNIDANSAVVEIAHHVLNFGLNHSIWNFNFSVCCCFFNNFVLANALSKPTI